MAAIELDESHRVDEADGYTAPRRTNPFSVGGHLLAATGAGIMFTVLALYAAIGPARLSLVGFAEEPGALWLAFTVTVMAALGAVSGTALVRYPAAARLAWVLVAVVVFLVTFADQVSLADIGILMVFSTAGGLVLGGILASLGVVDRYARAAIAIGLAIGIVLGAAWGLLATELARLVFVTGRFDQIGTRTLAVVIAIAGLVAMLADRLTGRTAAAATAIAGGATASEPATTHDPVTTSDPAPHSDPVDAGPAEVDPAKDVARPSAARRLTWWGPTVTVLAVTAAVAGLQLVAGSVLRSLSVSSNGGTSIRREDAVDALHEASHVTIGLLAGAALLVVAYRRGGRDLARWVVVGFAAALPLATGLPWIGTIRGQALLFLVILVAVGGLAGAALVLRADRFAPWDAVALAVAAVAVLATSARGRQEMPQLADGLVAVQAVFGSAALAAGMCRLVGPRSGAVRRGLDGGDVAGSAVLGFAAFLISLQMYGAVYGLSASRYGDMQLATSITVAVAAAVLAVLFSLGRMVDRIRRELVAEAAAPGQLPG